MLALASCVAVCSTLVSLAAAPTRRPGDKPAAVEGSDTIRFTAQVLQPPRLPSDADSGRTAWGVGADPRWVMVVHVEKVISGKAPFEAGTEQRFLIHSPTQAFCGDTPKVGQLYTWAAKVSRGADGNLRFLSLDACSDRNGKCDGIEKHLARGEAQAAAVEWDERGQKAFTAVVQQLP